MKNTTIGKSSNPDVRSELENLEKFYTDRRGELEEKLAKVEADEAAKRIAAENSARDERYARVAEQATHLLTVSKRADDLCDELFRVLRERVEVSREIRRIAPDHPGVKAFGNIFEHRRVTQGSFVAAGLHAYAEMSPRGGQRLHEVDTRYIGALTGGA